VYRYLERKQWEEPLHTPGGKHKRPVQNFVLLRHKGHEVRNTSSPGQNPKLQLFASEALAKQGGTPSKTHIL
jgi:hypothetical protein